MLNFSARWKFYQHFHGNSGFYRGGEKKLKCPSCGNCMMRLTLDVAIQFFVKRDENNSVPRKCNFRNTKMTTN
jgi:C4-type Zn-finger protein